MISLSPLSENNIDFASSVYTSSFPIEERRDFSLLSPMTKERREFYFSVLQDEVSNIGIFSYWIFESFAYIEHFAIEQSKRNKGYGSAAISLFVSLTQKPIIIEVEEPLTMQAKRRISFYERHNFYLLPQPYKQPPYRPNENFLPMKIMANNLALFSLQSFEDVVATLYSNVYSVR